jgi:hypothetical protein
MHGAVQLQARAGLRHVANDTPNDRRPRAADELGALVGLASLRSTSLNHPTSLSR